MSHQDPTQSLTASQRPRQNPVFEPRDAFDMYVQHIWELCDGLTTVDQILELSKLGVNRTLTVLGALRMSGGLLLPGEAPGDVEVSDWPGAAPIEVADEPSAPARSSRPGRFPRGSDAPPIAPFDDSARVEGLFNQACVYDTKGNYDDALRLFGVVIRDAPSSENLRRAARCALSAWKLDLAESWILDAIELDSLSPMSLRVLADVYLAQERYERAKVVLTRAIEIANPHGQLISAMRIDLDYVLKLLARRG